MMKAGVIGAAGYAGYIKGRPDRISLLVLPRNSLFVRQ
jgi:hypothetical protein